MPQPVRAAALCLFFLFLVLFGLGQDGNVRGNDAVVFHVGDVYVHAVDVYLELCAVLGKEETLSRIRSALEAL